MKYKTHSELHEEWMSDPEYRAAYEAEERKERLQALLIERKEHALITEQKHDMTNTMGHR